MYVLSRKLGKLVWDIVVTWNFFEKQTIGMQWVRAADSIAANIAEGYGRFYFKDTIRFYYMARGSLFETSDWFSKAAERKVISPDDQDRFRTLVSDIPKEFNILIKRNELNAQQYSDNKPINQ